MSDTHIYTNQWGAKFKLVYISDENISELEQQLETCRRELDEARENIVELKQAVSVSDALNLQLYKMLDGKKAAEAERDKLRSE